MTIDWTTCKKPLAAFRILQTQGKASAVECPGASRRQRDCLMKGRPGVSCAPSLATTSLDVRAFVLHGHLLLSKVRLPSTRYPIRESMSMSICACFHASYHEAELPGAQVH